MEIKKLHCLIITVVAVIEFSLVSCENENIDTPASVSEVNDLYSGQSDDYFPDRILNSKGSGYDKYVHLDLYNYAHIIEETSDLYWDACGPLTFVLGKHYMNSDYPLTKKRAKQVRRDAISLSKENSLDLYSIYLQSGQKKETFLNEVSGNRLWGNKRELMKKFIYNQLSKGRPVLTACIFNMETNPNHKNENHYYLIVGLLLRHKSSDDNYTYGGSGSYVLVKDVWRGGQTNEECERTKYFDYSQFLNSIWYSTQRKYINDKREVKPGSESYSALAIIQ